MELLCRTAKMIISNTKAAVYAAYLVLLTAAHMGQLFPPQQLRHRDFKTGTPVAVMCSNPHSTMLATQQCNKTIMDVCMALLLATHCQTAVWELLALSLHRSLLGPSFVRCYLAPELACTTAC